MTDVEKILAYIKGNAVLTICSAQGNVPWAANCFYVFDAARMQFLILTSLETRHGAEIQENCWVAGTFSSQQTSVIKIRGLQYSAIARRLAGEEEEGARNLYYRKFPAARLHSAPIWSVAPYVLKLTDNTLGFGTKIVWTKPER